jgi:hypothetical protein
MKLFERKKKSNLLVWKMIGGVGLAALAVELIVNFHDIKRYIKITTM